MKKINKLWLLCLFGWGFAYGFSGKDLKEYSTFISEIKKIKQDYKSVAQQCNDALLESKKIITILYDNNRINKKSYKRLDSIIRERLERNYEIEKGFIDLEKTVEEIFTLKKILNKIILFLPAAWLLYLPFYIQEKYKEKRGNKK